MTDYNPLVTVNILSYNRKNELYNTLKKVYEQDYKNIEVIVVDNASTDGSSDMVECEFPDVILIKLNKNVGIIGWNEGFKIAKGKYILVLDDDSYPAYNTIRYGVDRCEQGNGNIGIIAFNIINKYFDRSETESFSENPVSFIGCGALISKTAMNAVGYYNDLYFIYHNELDYSIRSINKGINIVYLRNAIIIHNFNVKSRGKTFENPLVSEFRYYNYFLSYSIFIIQNFSFKYFPKLMLKWILNRLIICFKYPFVKSFIKALVKIAVLLPKLIKNRTKIRPEVQSLYLNYIPLVDRDYFPDFVKPFSKKDQ